MGPLLFTNLDLATSCTWSKSAPVPRQGVSRQAFRSLAMREVLGKAVTGISANVHVL
jgi:hypothetical protein